MDRGIDTDTIPDDVDRIVDVTLYYILAYTTLTPLARWLVPATGLCPPVTVHVRHSRPGFMSCQHNDRLSSFITMILSVTFIMIINFHK